MWRNSSEQKYVFEQKSAERTPDSKSPGRETLAPKLSVRRELKNHIFDQIENSDTLRTNFHHFWMINQGYNPIIKVFGTNGRRGSTLAKTFSIESPVFVASRPPQCSNDGTQVFLHNYSANSELQFFSFHVRGHFLMSF